MSDLPTAADEARFWTIIESAWELVGDESAALRKGLIHRENDDAADTLDKDLATFLDHLQALSEPLSSDDLTALDRVLERKLYDLDRADIHEITDGSDDGFLYCRGFIVAMGQDFYNAVIADPAVSVVDAECGKLCYFFAHLHSDRVGSFPKTNSGISRESFSNPAGWN
ncbi:DUF4240 domain-containing protein [Nocardia sp. NPDC050175]|uniref:DUF4240 domain-containing protein n=1 Tax=Nocardia sp. NPDC050175 TaxID=3364317 RepID=UPI00379DF69D